MIMSMFLYEKVLVFLNVNLTYVKDNSIVGFLLLVFFFPALIYSLTEQNLRIKMTKPEFNMRVFDLGCMFELR